MKFEELTKNLNNNIEPCYLINGGESFLTTQALDRIEKAIGLSFADINKNVFYDSTTRTAKDIVEACEELPFCDSRRLVVVHDYLNKKNEQEKKIFANYLKKPNPSTCLVFFSTNKSDFFTSLEKLENINMIECEKLSPEAFNKYIDFIVKNAGLQIDFLALNSLKEYCNYSITKIDTEVNKFKTVFVDDHKITVEDIENYVTKDIEYAIFDLTNALSKQDAQTAFLLVDNIIKNKEQPVAIVSSIANHFRKLFLIARSDFDNVKLAQVFNVKEFAIKKYREQAKNFSIKQLKKYFDLSIEIEYKCKSGGMDGKNGLVYLISSILS